MYDELVKQLREDMPTALANCDFDFVEGWSKEAADAIESLEKENHFLKMMQQQMVDKIPMDDIGRMAYAALKRGKHEPFVDVFWEHGLLPFGVSL